MEEKEFLAHHGIRGQKWGIRRFQNSDGTLTEEGKKRYYKYGSSDASSLSDDELRNKTNRLQQEANYKRLVKELGTPEERKEDRELREAVTRLQNEANYKRLIKELGLSEDIKQASEHKQSFAERREARLAEKDEIMKKKIERLQRKIQYKKLVKELEDLDRNQKGHPFLKKVIGDPLTDSLSAVTKTMATRGIENVIARRIINNDSRYEKFLENERYRKEIFNSQNNQGSKKGKKK